MLVSRALLLLAGLVISLLAASTVRADTLSEVKARGALIWGADQEGGAPYVYPREDDPDRVTGFEVEIAERIANALNVEPRFAQSNWDKLPDMLRAKKVDVVLNGYEWSEARAEQMESTLPYYVYALRLIARKDDTSLRGIQDLAKKKPNGEKRRVGVLSASAAQRWAEKELGDSAEIVVYEGNTDALAETQNEKLDATVQDNPIASFYAPRFPKLHVIGEPFAEGYYVMFVPKGETALVRAMNEALVQMLKSGELERIEKKYGIWDSRQKKLFDVAEGARFFGLSRALDTQSAGSAQPEDAGVSLSSRKRGFGVVTDYGWVLLQSAGLTVILSVLSFPLAILIGLGVAVGRLWGPGWLRAPLTLYVEFLRGTPLMLQLYFIFFFLPEVGIKIPAFTTAILGLAINYSAYEAEIYRAGLQAIPGGQMEAALSLGMSRWQAIRRIVVPQAVRIVIPPVVNDFIALFKDTSVCSVITLVELTKRYSVLSMSTQATIELMILTAILYLAMSYPLSLAARRLEGRFGAPALA
jgi:polar amino acid transport system substrate-binding protein